MFLVLVSALATIVFVSVAVWARPVAKWDDDFRSFFGESWRRPAWLRERAWIIARCVGVGGTLVSLVILVATIADVIS